MKKKYQVLVSFEKIVEVEAEDRIEAEEIAIAEMLDNMELQNELLENELETKVVCANCGVSLNLDEEERLCVQCENK